MASLFPGCSESSRNMIHLIKNRYSQYESHSAFHSSVSDTGWNVFIQSRLCLLPLIHVVLDFRWHAAGLSVWMQAFSYCLCYLKGKTPLLSIIRNKKHQRKCSGVKQRLMGVVAVIIIGCGMLSVCAICHRRVWNLLHETITAPLHCYSVKDTILVPRSKHYNLWIFTVYLSSKNNRSVCIIFHRSFGSVFLSWWFWN